MKEGNNIVQMSFNDLNNLVNVSLTDRNTGADTSLQWDDSPEQYLLEDSEQDSTADTLDYVCSSTPLFDTGSRRGRLQASRQVDFNDTLTSEDENGEVFFHDLGYLDLPITESRLKRSDGIRRKRSIDTHRDRPRVQLGVNAPVQDVTQALAELHTSYRESSHPARVPRLDYALLHRHGQKKFKQGGSDGAGGSREETGRR